MLVFKVPLLVIVLIGVLARKSHQTAEDNQPQAAGESAELWRLHHGVSYLFSEAEGSCAEAQKFCLQKHSEVATMTNANKDWIASQAEGRKLWMNMDDLVTGHSSVTVHQCPASPSSTEKRGWVCERKEAPILHRHARSANNTDGKKTGTAAPKSQSSSAPSVQTCISMVSAALLSITLLNLF